MSVNRLGLQQIVDRLRAGLTNPQALMVSSAMHNDFLANWQTTYPAVWVMGQRMAKSDDGDGLTGGAYRQKMKVLITVRIVVQKFSAGVLTNEAGLITLADLVNDILLNWQPAGATKPLRLETGQDGPVLQSVLTTDILYGTSVTYSK